MKQPKFGPLYLACGLFMVIVVFFMIYVNYFVKKVTNVDSLAANLDSRKFQGLLIEKKALADPNNHFLFSWLHAYQFVFDTKIDQNLKAEIARSVLKFHRVRFDPILTLLLNDLTHKHPNKTLAYVIKPIGLIILDGLEQMDRLNVYRLVIESNQAPCRTDHKVSLNWRHLMINAGKDGKNACRTDPFSIDDIRYDNHIKPKLKYFRNSSKRNLLWNSREFNDFHLLLCGCKELKPGSYLL